NYLKAASDLEQTGRLQSALRSYERAAIEWPDQPTARLGLGNTRWALNDKHSALDEFQRLVNEFPDFQPGWNNLAIALEDLGCPAQAATARECSKSVDKSSSCTNLKCGTSY